MQAIIKTFLFGGLAVAACAADEYFAAAQATDASKYSHPSLFELPVIPRPDVPREHPTQPLREAAVHTTRATFDAVRSPDLAMRSNKLQAPYTTSPRSPTVRLTVGADMANKSVSSALVTLGPRDDLSSLVRDAPGVVLLDFYADWCGPCQAQGKILHAMQGIAARNKASMIKINVDEHEEIANILQVSALPTLLLVKDGKIVERKTGVADRREINLMLAR